MVIATRDRTASLARTLRALAGQSTRRPWELIVVDDAGVPPLEETMLSGIRGARLLRGAGAGPARARNLGLHAAEGRIVLFTDDDTEPEPGWIEAAASHLDANPTHLGVEGAVRSTPYDPLYGHSVQRDSPGGYMTCNLGFRREVLERFGGFSEDYVLPHHCEDVDLAYRVMEDGPIGFSSEMTILHHARELSLREWIAKGRMARSEILLFARFPYRFGRAARLPPRLFPLASAVAHCRRLAREGARGPWHRALRAVAIALGYTAVVAWTSLRSPAPKPARLASARS